MFVEKEASGDQRKEVEGESEGCQEACKDKKGESEQVAEGRELHCPFGSQFCGNGMEPFFLVKLHILAGVEYIKTGCPENDSQP